MLIEKDAKALAARRTEQLGEPFVAVAAGDGLYTVEPASAIAAPPPAPEPDPVGDSPII